MQEEHKKNTYGRIKEKSFVYCSGTWKLPKYLFDDVNYWDLGANFENHRINTLKDVSCF